MAYPGQQYQQQHHNGGYQQQQGGYGQQQGYGNGFPQPQYNVGSGGYAPPQQSYGGPPPQQYGQQGGGQYPTAPPQYAHMPMHQAPQNQPGPQQGRPYFQYSNCSGKRKGLLIGINYTGSSNALRGCHNDARNLHQFLVSRYNFNPDDMVLMLDDPSMPYQAQPTRQNIIRAMQWLVKDAQPNDSLFFHYSGHGGQTEDLDGDEDDGYDEVIYPVDFKQTSHIVDDDMHMIMVRPLPPGCRLTAIFDSCHSASALDLPYIYSTQGKIKEPNLLADAGQGAMSAVGSYMRGDMIGAVTSIVGFGKRAMKGNSAEELTRKTRTAPCDAISWSGCKDSQTSADASVAGNATGAMSYAFVAALSKYPQQTYLQLLNSIRDELRGKYEQKPQLSSSHEMDVNLMFII
ncbi:uncharacterized protein L969DRAFT_84532 [Mixia osmundae IAM 14324]|uniref:Peptidase C14 caspase domain-containing protein n=1 Tax=Mixia osmundae (strain CBS 9802 / IAM 14324 / JCM 22182 / KY 12970) TaxID=764103 RepID=G7E570_MIXOS|nr:uncharacterized protein L969DRAFT_84532 [Mixia osmundae IAM 14324]KEI42663.1 hypothetical protein L969DRAFT_84532 [Mixia osmundae IAM 14324]GAA97980.1 hypothetical protein E5Q_04660 [Mixia osmundae IAM 14324]